MCTRGAPAVTSLRHTACSHGGCNRGRNGPASIACQHRAACLGCQRSHAPQPHGHACIMVRATACDMAASMWTSASAVVVVHRRSTLPQPRSPMSSQAAQKTSLQTTRWPNKVRCVLHVLPVFGVAHWWPQQLHMLMAVSKCVMYAWHH